MVDKTRELPEELEKARPFKHRVHQAVEASVLKSVALIGIVVTCCSAQSTSREAKVLGFYTAEEVGGGDIVGHIDSLGNIQATVRQYSTARNVLVLETDAELIAMTSASRWAGGTGLLSRRLARNAIPTVAPGATVRVWLKDGRATLLDTEGKSCDMRVLSRALKQTERRTAKQAVEHAGPVSQQSHVSLGSEPPGADIEINGEYVGSPPSALTLQPGKYRIVLSKEGFTKWVRELVITQGSSVRVAPTLDPVKKSAGHPEN